jgi:Helix-turn-helix domain
MKPQTRAVLTLLLERGERGLTPLDITDDDVWSLRLAARIHELRQAGIEIATERTRTIGGAKIARYRLAAPVQTGLWP